MTQIDTISMSSKERHKKSLYSNKLTSKIPVRKTLLSGFAKKRRILIVRI